MTYREATPRHGGRTVWAGPHEVGQWLEAGTKPLTAAAAEASGPAESG